MKAWLVPILLIVCGVWMLWAQAQMQQHVVNFLARRAAGRRARGALLTHVCQAAAAALAVAALVGGVMSEIEAGLVWVRVALVVLVLTIYVPFASTLARTRIKKIRTPVELRLEQAGAPPDVALAIARAGRPWSLVGSLVMLAGVLVLVWHH